MNGAAGTKFFLTALEGPAMGREFVLVGPEVRIGRTEENDIVLNEKSVSRHHATVRVEGDGLVIEDAGSKNGILVNERRVKRAPLCENDTVRLGLNVFRVGAETPKVTLENFRKLLERAPAAADLAKKIGGRRLVLYGAGLSLLGFGVWASASRSLPPPPLSAARETSIPPLQIAQAAAPANATAEEVVGWQAQAEKALRFRDYAAAIPFLQKVVAIRSGDSRAAGQLARAKEEFSVLVTRYYESGAREYEKMYYEKAIAEWQKVLALTSGLDRDTFKRTEARIAEVNHLLSQKR